jgi:hypothetical protein
MDRGLSSEAMKVEQKTKTKYVHEGRYVAAVEVSLIEDEHGWGPYLSLADAYRLDEAREALRAGDLQRAANYGQIYELHPVR